MQNDSYLYLHTTENNISHSQHNFSRIIFSFIVGIPLPSLPLVVSLSRIKKVPLGFPNDSSCLSASFRPSLPKYHLRETPEIVTQVMLGSIAKQCHKAQTWRGFCVEAVVTQIQPGTIFVTRCLFYAGSVTNHVDADVPCVGQ